MKDPYGAEKEYGKRSYIAPKYKVEAKARSYI